MYTRFEVDAGGNRIGRVSGVVVDEVERPAPKKASTKGMVKIQATKEHGGETFFVTEAQFAAFKEFCGKAG